MTIWPKIALIILLSIRGSSTLAQTLETRWLRTVNLHATSGSVDIAQALSQTTGPLALMTPLAIALPKFDEGRKIGWSYLAQGYGSILIASGISYGLKLGFRRERPYQKYPDYINARTRPGTFSFPSGHTTSAFCAATYASLACPKWYVIVPAYTYAAGVGWARMHLGVHYPSDVAAGIVIGSGTAIGMHLLANFIRARYLQPKSTLTQ